MTCVSSAAVPATTGVASATADIEVEIMLQELPVHNDSNNCDDPATTGGPRNSKEWPSKHSHKELRKTKFEPNWMKENAN